MKVQGLLTGTPYPELSGTYQIVSSTGYIADVDFSGKKFFGMSGEKNGVHAALYGPEDGGARKRALYTVQGAWNGTFTFRDESSGEDVEVYDTAANPATALEVADMDLQDPWESRKAWGETIRNLHAGQMQAVSDAKSKVEQGQREMRRQEEADHVNWEPVFFRNDSRDDRFERLVAVAGVSGEEDARHGFWRFDGDRAAKARKPFHGDLTPDNSSKT